MRRSRFGVRVGSLVAFSVAWACGLLLAERPAAGFSTRLHILIANKVREALIADGGNRIRLKFGTYDVQLSDEDRRAIEEQPLSFRAGAIGPDNMAFPGMTDPSHAIGQKPYVQCQKLYEQALTDPERAYAIGCFLHGVTDAIAHHYVNFMSGETFTLTPITAGRQSNYSNVVRHMIAESMIQKAALKLDPTAFDLSHLTHSIPKEFLQRTYLSTASPVWQVMARHAKAKYDAAVAAQPNASIVTIVQGLDVAIADHLVLSPVYLARIDQARQQIASDVMSAVSAMQNRSTTEGATLQVTAGADGKLGTSDDGTACTVSCADLYAKYFTYVALLAPRQDAQGRPLPSALEKISDKLRDDLNGFLPAYLTTIESLSLKLNTPLSSSSTGTEGFDINPAEVDMMFKPMTDWADRITTLDYQVVINAVVPDWLLALQNALQKVGINVSIPNIVKTLLDPFVRPVKDAIKAYVIDKAKTFINDLTTQYKAQLDVVLAEYDGRLKLYAGAGLSGTPLDHFFDSGLFGHAFNIAAATLANHAVALPVNDSDELGGIGPASFDASHTAAWSQAAACEYLRGPILPLGIEVSALLSVRSDKDYIAQTMGDSPVECHAGSLSMFTASPTPQSCALVDTPSLIRDGQHMGSPTRSYPPQYSGSMPSCQNITVPGLPEPPPSAPVATGCSCQLGHADTPPPLGYLALAATLSSLLLLRRRRLAATRRSVAGLALLAALLLSGPGCGGTPTMMEMIPDPMMNQTPKQALMSALKDSAWNGMQLRSGKQRAIELRFRTTDLFWAETRNPFGPARRRELRVFSIDEDGSTVRSTITQTPDGPDTTRPLGKQESWKIEIVPGTPRKLRLTNQESPSIVEEYTEGAWPAPQAGLTATVRVFSAAGGAPAYESFCGKSLLSTPDYSTLFASARGRSTETLLGTDLMAGAKLVQWRDSSGANRFAVTDVPSFSDLGGTLLSDQANFFVHYQGTINHPGGAFQITEDDDEVADGIWAFIENKVGSSNPSDLFLEVHSLAIPDKTVDAPSTTPAAGLVPIEIIVLRCNKTIKDIDIKLRLNGGAYQHVGNVSSNPTIDDTLFPPAL